jgi:hypothetical protein
MKTTQKKSKDFLISDGGPLYNTLTRIPLFNTQKRLAVLGLCLTWLPLVVISGLEGTLFSGVEMPFLYDIAMQARVLIALPMLIIIRVAIDGKVRAVINHFGTTLLSPEEREYIINTTFRRAKKLTSSALTEIIFLLLVIIATVSLVKGGVYSGLESGMTTWMATENEGGQTLSFAGYWSVFVSIPLFQFFFIAMVLALYCMDVTAFQVVKNESAAFTNPCR